MPQHQGRRREAASLMKRGKDQFKPCVHAGTCELPIRLNFYRRANKAAAPLRLCAT